MMNGVSRMVIDAIYHISRGSTFLSILGLLYWASLLIFTLQCLAAEKKPALARQCGSWRYPHVKNALLPKLLPPIYPHQWILHKIDASIGPPPIVCHVSDVVADFMKVKHTIHNLPSSLW